MTFLLSIWLTLNWNPSPEYDVIGYRVYERCSSTLDGGGWFTDYTEVTEPTLTEDVEENVIHYRCVTAINVYGMESDPCPAIWRIFVRDKPRTAVNK